MKPPAGLSTIAGWRGMHAEQRVCRYCHQPYVPVNPQQTVTCSAPECKRALAKAARARYASKALSVRHSQSGER